MTHTLKDLLKPEQAEALTTIVGKVDRVTGKPASIFTPPEDLVPAKAMSLEAFVDAVVDPLTLPDPLVPEVPDVAPAALLGPEPTLGVDVVRINGVEVDLKGDAMYVTPCADCGTLRQVEVAPEGVDLSKERVVVCPPCLKIRVLSEGPVRIIRDPRVAKHQPRLKDGPDQPVEVKHIAEKEHDVDLNGYTPPQLAALIERATDIMRTKAEDALAPRVKAAIAAAAEADAKDQGLLEVHRESRSGYVLPAFTVKEVEVPALDLSEITDMSMVMPAKQRSPYNKALYRTGSPIVEADKATYEEMAKHHEALREVAGYAALAKSEGKGKKPKGKKAEAVKITAAVEPKAKAKFSKAQVAALAEVRGISKGEARALLESI